jgi:hypothetical protein
MATVQLSNRAALRLRLRNTPADRSPGDLGPSPSLLQTLACASRRMVGVVLLLLAILVMSTLLLLPVGLPLALLAVALIAAPSGSSPLVTANLREGQAVASLRRASFAQQRPSGSLPTANRRIVVRGLTKAEAEDVLDWLEGQGLSGQLSYLEGEGFAVR